MNRDAAEKLVTAMSDLDEVRVMETVAELVIDDEPSFNIFEKLNEGMRLVEKKYHDGFYYIADLIMAGYIMKSVMDKMLDCQRFGDYSSWGNIVAATVEGDIHELGKNVIVEILRHNGFRVDDLGVDVLSGTIVRRLREGDVHILILSGMLKESKNSMIKAVNAIKKAGLRDKVSIIVGGNAVDPSELEEIGADAVSTGVFKCLNLCQNFMADKVRGI